MTTVSQDQCLSDVDQKMERKCYVSAAIWGGFVALFLQKTELGRFLADRRTWVTVVLGVAGNLAIIRPLVSEETWGRMFNVFALSSLGVIARSLWKEIRFEEEIKRGAEDTTQCQA